MSNRKRLEDGISADNVASLIPYKLGYYSELIDKLDSVNFQNILDEFSFEEMLVEVFLNQKPYIVETTLEDEYIHFNIFTEQDYVKNL